MKRTALILSGLVLAGPAAFALQETGSQDEYESTTTQGDEPTGDPEMGTLPEGETNAYGEEVGERSSHDVTQMSPEELAGMIVTTEEGEEVGTIQDAGYSTTHREQVATIDVGGFLGAGEKVIAVPLSELEMGSDGSLVATMSREELEAEPEFDPSELTTETTGESQDW